MGKAIVRNCWCGGKRARPAYRVKLANGATFSYVQCLRCGVLIQHPMISNDDLPAYYAPEYYGTTRKKFIGPLAAVVAWFQERRACLVVDRVPRGGKVLDVGTGNGGFLLQMAERGMRVEGTEWTQESADRIPEHSEVGVHVGDLLDLNLEEGGYDAVTLWHVFEHLRDPEATVREIRRLLKVGGTLFLSLPNQESWQARLFGSSWFHLDPPRHLHGFGPKSLGRLLKKHGFKVIHQNTWSLEQNPYGVLQSLLNAAGFPRDRAYDQLKGTAKTGFAIKALDLLLLGLLAPIAMVIAIVEYAMGRGGTMTVIARKRGNH